MPSKKKFDSLLNTINDNFLFLLKFKNDTSYIDILIQKKTYVKLQKHDLDVVKLHLNTRSEEKHAFKDYIVINYTSGNYPARETNRESTANIYHRDYLKKIKQNYRL